MKPWAVTVLLLVGAGAMAGEVYRWTDGQGQLHFGDKPPADAAATQVETTGDCLAHEIPADCAQRVAKARKLDERRMREALKAQDKPGAGKSGGTEQRKGTSRRRARERDASEASCPDRQREIHDLDDRIRHQLHTGADLSYLRKRLRELEWTYHNACTSFR
jgi:Domain of unknown function (DUF4124)